MLGEGAAMCTEEDVCNLRITPNTNTMLLGVYCQLRGKVGSFDISRTGRKKIKHKVIQHKFDTDNLTFR